MPCVLAEEPALPLAPEPALDEVAACVLLTATGFGSLEPSPRLLMSKLRRRLADVVALRIPPKGEAPQPLPTHNKPKRPSRK